ncbi:transposase [Roseateles sp. BYS78W]|uniref:Transposase n=1 Tax=Pelomonas candidula TaxID=3299025 RepID=A0ABW7HDG4_9BURK
MELMHNQLFKLLEPEHGAVYAAGLYRVILNEPGMGKVVAVHLDPPERQPERKCGRRRLERTLRARKKTAMPLVGALIWMDAEELKRLDAANLLMSIELDRDPVCFSPLQNAHRQREYERRIAAMAGFLDFKRLEEGILVHQGLGGLVKEAMSAAGVSRTYVYKQWSTLARLGISELSLYPRQDLSGGPGQRRFCGPGGRKKPGPKTIEERIAKAFGKPIDPPQPGMTEEWQDRMLAADRKIQAPTLSLRARYEQVIKTAFVLKYKQVGREVVPVELKEGAYPNFAQFKWLITTRKSALECIQERTTKGHFDRALRGLTGKSWKGVPGPGHTWAIDSTVGDIYLRSSVNRAWIIGRPIVYIIVDVWSTAIVGFYVCLSGPSWATAKISLFNAIADPQTMGALWGYQPLISLDPHPTLCYCLLCDRGEYLSLAARQTLLKLEGCGSYAPPYRPDLKGLVEVLHRIMKDQQFPFIPGAIDFRRAEYELRRVRMEDSAYTLPEYVQHLHEIFWRYNLTADRNHRLDVHMIGEGVYPSPAGLWRYGHQIGLGFSRSTPTADLIQHLLPETGGRIKKDGVYVGGQCYEAPQLPGLDWTAKARNLGYQDVTARYYPGSISRVWTPHPVGKGFLELKISDQARASSELTFDEVADAFAYQKLSSNRQEHVRLIARLESMLREGWIRRNAMDATAEAISRAKGAAPSATLAREIEKSLGGLASEADSAPASASASASDEEEYFEIMNDIMAAANNHDD